MKAANTHTQLVDGYFELLKNLSADTKLELISKLSDSLISTHAEPKEKTLKELYGSFVSDKSAEEMVEEIRSSRTFNRQIENLD